MGPKKFPKSTLWVILDLNLHCFIDLRDKLWGEFISCFFAICFFQKAGCPIFKNSGCRLTGQVDLRRKMIQEVPAFCDFLVPKSNHEMGWSWIPRTLFSVKPHNGLKRFLKSTFWVFFHEILIFFHIETAFSCQQLHAYWTYL